MKKPDTYNILFCGIGGQGVLKAAEVVGWAATIAGYHTKKTEVHGMAQRGGSVESHVRFGKTVYSPLIPKGRVDFLVPFHRDEGVRLADFLKPGGVDFTGALVRMDACIRDRRYLNTYLIGMLAQKLPLKDEHWLKALRVVFAHKDLDENKRIFFSAKEVQV